jgi:hypothetical protein
MGTLPVVVGRSMRAVRPRWSRTSGPRRPGGGAVGLPIEQVEAVGEAERCEHAQRRPCAQPEGQASTDLLIGGQDQPDAGRVDELQLGQVDDQQIGCFLLGFLDLLVGFVEGGDPTLSAFWQRADGSG